MVDGERALTIGMFLVVLFMIVKAFMKLWPFLRKFVDLVNTLVGDDDEPGIKVRMDVQADKLDVLTGLQEKQTEELEKVRAQVQNSHTETNLREDVDALQRTVDSLAQSLRTHLDGCTNTD